MTDIAQSQCIQWPASAVTSALLKMYKIGQSIGPYNIEPLSL